MIPRSALLNRNDPALVQCPGCGHPVNVDHDWTRWLVFTGNVMTCCNRQLTPGEVAVFMAKVRKAREAVAA